eukprot:11543486-Karenia_brevis.AAC.1
MGTWAVMRCTSSGRPARGSPNGREATCEVGPALLSFNGGWRFSVASCSAPRTILHWPCGESLAACALRRPPLARW